MGRRYFSFLIAFSTFWLLAYSHPAQAKPKKVVVSAIPVGFSLIDKSKAKFDKLIYRGGVELTSEDKNFGGFSGLVLGHLGKKIIIVSDRGRWFGGQVVYHNGKITGLKHMLYDRLTQTSGKNLRGKNNKDAESITTLKSHKLQDGILVAFEREEKLYAYKVKGTKVLPGARAYPLPPEIRNGPHNQELETVIRFHKGKLKNTVLLFSENHRDDKNNIKGWLLKNKIFHPLSIKPYGNFYITDAAILPNGDVLILERAVSPFTGWSMQIRMVKSHTIKKAAILDGPVLLQASQFMMIDNMEGISVHKNEDGRVIISLISDNNFKKFQRTLLHQFEIPAALLTSQ